jgi:hypothetical protein
VTDGLFPKFTPFTKRMVWSAETTAESIAG